jgi:hypothetical protein
MKVEYRPATAADSRYIARLFCMAGGGPYEFLFDDLIPFVTAADVLSMEIGVAPIGCHPWLTHTGGSILCGRRSNREPSPPGRSLGDRVVCLSLI